MNATRGLALLLGASSAGPFSLPVAADDAELAQQTQNPIAALISLPFQLNYDETSALMSVARSGCRTSSR